MTTATATAVTMTTGKAPRAVPVLGHVPVLRRRPLEFLESLPALGDLVEIRLGLQRAFVPTHPDLIWQVLIDNKTFDKGGPIMDVAREMLGDGLATCEAEPHYRQRHMVNPGFHRDRLAGYGGMMTEIVKAAVDSWLDGQAVDVTHEMMLVTTRVAARTLAQLTLDDPAAVETLEMYSTMTHEGYRRVMVPAGVARKLPTPGNRRFLGAKRRLHALVEQTIAGYHHDGADRGDFMSSLLAARGDRGEVMSAEELHNQVGILLTGEIETTGSALAWAFRLLAQYPQVEAALHDEVDQVLGGRVATWDDVANLPVTNRVLTESLRIYPPVWFLTRLVTRDTELAGRAVPAGSTVVFSPYVVHRNPAYYPSPDVFDPDRWLPGRHEKLPRGAYVPFAAGARRCIGDKFALGEAAIALASISGRWRLEPAFDAPIKPAPRAILRPPMLPMIARLRSA